MGNCVSGSKKKRKGKSAPDDGDSTDSKPTGDVTYVSIDHSDDKRSRPTRALTDDDCNYAEVHIPAERPTRALTNVASDYAEVRVPAEPLSDSSSKEDCADDYVLMG